MENQNPHPSSNGDVAPAPRTKRAIEKRRRVMEAAARLISEKGYHETSMRDIAGELGMSAASLYHYFPGKEDLVVALQSECFSEIVNLAKDRVRNVTDPTERLYTFVSNHMTYFVEHIALIRVLLHEDCCLSKANREIIKQFKQEYAQFCEDLIQALPREGGAPHIDSRVIVFSLFGMMNWYYTWQHAAPELTGQELADGMTQIFLRGILSSQTAVPQLVS